MHQRIEIHYDYVDGTELSYQEALCSDTDFTTNCLEFFDTANYNAILVRKDGSSMSVKDLLAGNGNHTTKEIRQGHNLHKMLIAGAFNW